MPGNSPWALLRSISMFFLLFRCLYNIFFYPCLIYISWLLTDTFCFYPFAAGLWAPLLPSVHTDTWPQFCNNLCLPSPQAPQGGASDRMCSLRVQGLCQRWLIFSLCFWAHDSSSGPNTWDLLWAWADKERRLPIEVIRMNVSVQLVSLGCL